MTDATKTDETPKEERKPLSPEAREQLKRELKAQVRAFADALKAQIREKKAKEAKGEEKAELDLDEAMRRADEEARKKMAESLKRDTIDVSSPEQDGGKAPAGEAAASDTGQEDGEEKKHVSALPKEELDRLTQDIIAALKTIYDPEIPVDIYELGLIYRIDISDDRVITIDMTLTAPGCPVAGDMPGWVQKAVGEVEGVKEVRVNLVFDPPWDMSRMSDEARLALNMW